jgi:hypothetical protein
VTTPDQILLRVRNRFASAGEALAWYQHAQVPGFAGKTAQDLVCAGRGQEVIDYLLAVDAGVYT